MTAQHDGDGTDFTDFTTFTHSLASARYEDFARSPAAAATSAEDFAAMTEYLGNLYRGIEVTRSFADDNGQVFDCVPIGSQPALRGNSPLPPEAPDPPPVAPGRHGGAQSVPVRPQLHSERLDRYGHPMSCPPGTIAMRRITPEEIAARGSVRDFHHKHPRGAGRRGPGAPAAGLRQHTTGVQEVANLGGHSYVNIWDPQVTGAAFTVSQQWFGTVDSTPVQTVECGYQVYPGKYGTAQPVLFIYWTADGYQHTGCYNLECTAFVQTNSAWLLGGTLGQASVTGGVQIELEVAWYLAGGNWWLYLGGVPVGYYPASLFGGGPLATGAGRIICGGEVYNVAGWPPMGSGAFAAGGWQYAAYHRDVQYVATNNTPQYAKLTAYQPAPNCYTSLVNSGPTPWYEYVFFGGPGGSSCS
ncbi:neprosin family prolyl endopeptidase [Kitasatospora sp. NPDC096140]|uniref:neprosin family prolyl endopeptidase n=1 Tax=Kitasatospora sp. NPDC096140 TaxID=3155425 RepID=UPI00331FC11E